MYQVVSPGSRWEVAGSGEPRPCRSIHTAGPGVGHGASSGPTHPGPRHSRDRETRAVDSYGGEQAGLGGMNPGLGRAGPGRGKTG